MWFKKWQQAQKARPSTYQLLLDEP